MNSYQSIVRIYISQIRPRAQAELDWFRKQPNLNSAIELASLAINSKGKRYSHQRRLKNTSLQQAKLILLANSRNLNKCESFDKLFSFIETVLQPVSGIGELYIYDTTLRIGAKLGLLPEKVYLHAGTKTGAKALGFDGTTQALEISVLPKELHQLEPHEIEDVLCIFKSELSDHTHSKSENGSSKHSWCD